MSQSEILQFSSSGSKICLDTRTRSFEARGLIFWNQALFLDAITSQEMEYISTQSQSANHPLVQQFHPIQPIHPIHPIHAIQPNSTPSSPIQPDST